MRERILLKNGSDRAAVVETGNHLGKQRGHRELYDIGRQLFLEVGNGICYHYLGETGISQSFQGRAREDGMGDAGVDTLGSKSLEFLGCADKGASGITEIIDNDHIRSCDISDKIHLAHSPDRLSLLDDHSKACLHAFFCQLIPKLFSACNPAGVGRKNHGILELFFSKIRNKNKGRIEIVHGSMVKKALNLPAVKIDS